ncbi:hypothetical protein PR202_gb01726 [Eleusine coracana subsp. coracana]|uniref:Uncharacterized protein n=1 Tax=Eleusine coracana subsp. coracana TaxID=191504 RepID=A0AAV5DVV3_ELECO|nr:hypothetical protein PR202_gb01726 [Eleusine coracana subsp. coracana]
MASQAIPVGSTSEEWRQLLQDTLGTAEGAAVAASLARREVIINVSSSDRTRPRGRASFEYCCHWQAKMDCQTIAGHPGYPAQHNTAFFKARPADWHGLADLPGQDPFQTGLRVVLGLGDGSTVYAVDTKEDEATQMIIVETIVEMVAAANSYVRCVCGHYHRHRSGAAHAIIVEMGHGDIETDIITHGAHDNSAVPVIVEEPASVLHVVATAGDSERHLKCARMIFAKASHLLTTAAPNSKGETPVHCAARVGNTKMVACLIELAKGVNGVDYDKARELVRMQNKLGETALHEAVRFDNLKMVQDLLSADQELAQIDAEDGTSPAIPCLLTVPYWNCSLDPR